MPRLFVALDLPDFITAELMAIRPAVVPGLRRVSVEQMHLTLHFLGEADIDPVAKALTEVAGDSFSLSIAGVGRFPPSGRASVLWAGVTGSAVLSRLHADIGRVLQAGGWPVETRPYHPHITLARCGFRVSPDVVNEFLSRHAKFALPEIRITGFGLYSSANVDGAQIYRREHWIALKDG